MKKKLKNDHLFSLIKSLKPIDFTYSKQNKEYEKYFNDLSLKSFLKSITTKAKHSVLDSPFFRPKKMMM